MALCTADDVENRLGGVSFTTTEAVLVGELINGTTGHIQRIAARTGRGESGPQTLEDDDRTETFDAPESPSIWLVHTPVNSVASVTVDGTALTSDQYEWSPAGKLTRVSNGISRHWATRKVESVVVAYNGGFQTVPEDLKDLCARVVARAWQSGEAYADAPDGAGSIRQVSLAGSDSVTFSTAVQDVSPSGYLTDAEIESVRYYRNDVLA